MIVALVSTALIAVASLSYGVYKAGECDALHLELAVARRHTENWAEAYYEAISDKNSDGADA